MAVIIYMILGYWAAGKVMYENKIVIYTGVNFICKKLAWGVLLGWILIPIAIIKLIFGK